MNRRIPYILSLLVLLVLLAACVPGLGQVIEAPTFRVAPEGVVLLSFEPPLIGSGEAVFRVPLVVSNPNALALKLAGLDFDFYVAERRALSSNFPAGLSLAAWGSSPLTLDIRIPLLQGVELLNDIAAIIAGTPTSYRLVGTVTVNVLGGLQTLPKATLVEGIVN